jgi:glycosyltransferase involved in cell wall biosynthesis
MKLVLILMIRNEEKILRRCLEAVQDVVDAYAICDTGSTDTTCDIADAFLKEGHQGCLVKTEWKNFGHNRSLSFVAAQAYVRDQLKWDLNDTYGLLLDADMVFVPGTLRQQTLTEVGYTIVQRGGTLEYPNCRLIRMDHNWVCRGVTHEYWDGPTKALSKTICHIDDRNDGGCKSDKFERDARLLEQGLKDDPENARYMFYLAQTYHSLGRHKDAIAMYKRRILAGGWFEEVWYSHYMIGNTYRELGNIPKFEQWMLRANEYRPGRAEALYALAKYFREIGHHYKAYHYVKMGQAIPMTSDSLFIDTDVYNGLFDYESTILMYYLTESRKNGLETSMQYLMESRRPLQHSTYSNIKFYIEPVGQELTPHPISRDVWGSDYHPSSVSIFTYNGKTYHNVRFVNYTIMSDGSYRMREGDRLDSSIQVRTQNVCYGEGLLQKMDDASVTLPRRQARIAGLEDVRVYTDASNQLRFVATSSEYSEKIRIIAGEYSLDGTYKNCKVMDSPTNAECEKNWIPIPGTDDVVYRWSPLEIGRFEGTSVKVHTRYETPWLFQHLRGSAPPVLVDGKLWFVVHFVEYSMPRKYFHCVISMDPKTYNPEAISMPFVFAKEGIEYCLGAYMEKDALVCAFSTWDDKPRFATLPTLTWTTCTATAKSRPSSAPSL